MLIPSKKDKAWFSHNICRIAILIAGDHCMDAITSNGEKFLVDGIFDEAHQWLHWWYLAHAGIFYPFIRVHKSYLVNFRFVDRIEDDKIIFKESFLKKLTPEIRAMLDAINITKLGWKDYERYHLDFTRPKKSGTSNIHIHPTNGWFSCSTASCGGTDFSVVYHFAASNGSSRTG
jgi:hypothetical protein